MNRIGIVYKDNFSGALALFMRLEKEKQEQEEFLLHNVSANCYARFTNCRIDVFEYTGVFHHHYDELYLDKYLDDNEISLCKRYAADVDNRQNITMF